MVSSSCPVRCVWLVIPLVLSIVGCGGGGGDHPDVAPVSGVVMYKGNPVVGAQVTFNTAGAPRLASGITDDKGEFKLSTFDVNDGAVPGEHTIAIAKFKSTAPAAKPKMDARAMTGNPSAMLDTYRETIGDPREANAGPESELPAKYAKAETSGLKETVSLDKENRFVFQLTD